MDQSVFELHSANSVRIKLDGACQVSPCGRSRESVYIKPRASIPGPYQGCWQAHFNFFFTTRKEDLPGRDWWATCPRRDVFETVFYVSKTSSVIGTKTELNEWDWKRASLTSAIMMSMNSKQAFSMHPILHEHKYTPLHSSSEAIRRACLPTPSVRSARALHRQQI